MVGFCHNRLLSLTVFPAYFAGIHQWGFVLADSRGFLLRNRSPKSKLNLTIGDSLLFCQKWDFRLLSGYSIIDRPHGILAESYLKSSGICWWGATKAMAHVGLQFPLCMNSTTLQLSAHLNVCVPSHTSCSLKNKWKNTWMLFTSYKWLNPRKDFKNRSWEPFVISYKQNSSANPAQVGWVTFAKDLQE